MLTLVLTTILLLAVAQGTTGPGVTAPVLVVAGRVQDLGKVVDQVTTGPGQVGVCLPEVVARPLLREVVPLVTIGCMTVVGGVCPIVVVPVHPPQLPQHHPQLPAPRPPLVVAPPVTIG